MPLQHILLLWSLLSPLFLFAQVERLPDPKLDVLHYRFHLNLSDESDQIQGLAEVQVRLKQAGIQSLGLDLVGARGSKGMTVKQVKRSGKEVTFVQQGDRLSLSFPPTTAEDTAWFVIEYQGIPNDGLIISKNRYGERTFFGDNWPNRAHHWLPTVDHPSDKAFCEFVITAPDHYQVVANGEMIEETDLDNGQRLTHWRSRVPLPTKVMVFGAARFAVQYLGEVNDIPLSSWVYPQNRKNGFYDYALAERVLRFMTDYIGPYPYAKLANVQSTTRYGGMENASNIFYSETSITGDRSSESLIAHEVAHQWFGNSASEASWFHIWLSEGFATYFTELYLEATYGPEALGKGMMENREQVIQSPVRNRPIVDPAVTNLNQLLNPNSYQKGAWVLHMLRNRIGDAAFELGIRQYYQEYQFANAMSQDFERIMEAVSGQDLTAFFQQWLYQPDMPVIEVEWSFDKSAKQLTGVLKQVQEGPLFDVPLEIGWQQADGSWELIMTRLNQREQEINIAIDYLPTNLQLDPAVHLLFEAN